MQELDDDRARERSANAALTAARAQAVHGELIIRHVNWAGEQTCSHAVRALAGADGEADGIGRIQAGRCLKSVRLLVGQGNDTSFASGFGPIRNVQRFAWGYGGRTF